MHKYLFLFGLLGCSFVSTSLANSTEELTHNACMIVGATYRVYVKEDVGDCGTIKDYLITLNDDPTGVMCQRIISDPNKCQYAFFNCSKNHSPSIITGSSLFTENGWHGAGTEILDTTHCHSQYSLRFERISK